MYKTYQCESCLQHKPAKDYVFSAKHGFRITAICNDCSDEKLIEQVDCKCTGGCGRKLPARYFQHYYPRFKKNGDRLRVNTNCIDCRKRENKVLTQLKKQNPPPPYLTPCPQCNRIVYEKSEDIPESVVGTNGPWQCDHDHATGTFRGYLCKQCNTGTGLIGDNADYFNVAKANKKSRRKKTIDNNT